MSYSLVIDGAQGASKVRRGTIPRRGEWLSVEMDGAWWWLPVLEVAHMLYERRFLAEAEDGCDYLHEKAEAVVFSSLALRVKSEIGSEGDAYKLVLPPTRWPLCAQMESERERDPCMAKE